MQEENKTKAKHITDVVIAKIEEEKKLIKEKQERLLEGESSIVGKKREEELAKICVAESSRVKAEISVIHI